MDFIAAGWTVAVMASLFDTFLRDEDGAQVIGECFQVAVTAPNGQRWVHQKSFSTEVRYDDDGYPHLTGYVLAEAAAEHLSARVEAGLKAGRQIAAGLWNEIDPAYGSEAYQAYGIEAQRAYEDQFAA
jgi:hypothetical protein